MKTLYTTLLFILLVWGGFAHADVDGVEVRLDVLGCNNNSICEPIIGENETSCPLDCPATSTSTPPLSDEGGGRDGGFGGRVGRLTIYNIFVQPQTHSATITWETNRLSLSTFVWGESLDFEKSAITEVTFRSKHSVVLTNLWPGKVYYFRISTVDIFNRRVETPVHLFMTLPLPGYSIPLNVSNAQAVPLFGAIMLLWQNPPIYNFNNVRILRSTYYYPRNPFDGKIVYEASGQSFRDSDVKKGVTYYYSIFVRDTEGNYSTGVALSANTNVGIDEVDPFDFSGTGVTFPSPSANIPGVPRNISTTTSSYLDGISLTDFTFIQNGQEILPTDGIVPVTGEDPITITVPSSLFPATFKYFLVHIQDRPNERNYNSYLMRLNKKQNVYEAFVNALGAPGKHPFTITIVDDDSRKYTEVTGIFDSHVTVSLLTEEEGLRPFYNKMLFFIILIIILLLILAFRPRKKRPQI